MATLNYQDIDYYGEETKSGSAKEYFGEDAMKKAFLTYLMSDPDDYLLHPQRGGVLTRLFHKNMNGVSLSDAYLVLDRVIKEEYRGITVNNISFIPNDVDGILEIDIDYIIDATGTQVNSSVNILTGVKNENYTYQNVEFIEVNLLNFCENKKASQGNNLLGFDTNLASFRWGNFVFINLTQNDPYFSAIETVCNT